MTTRGVPSSTGNFLLISNWSAKSSATDVVMLGNKKRNWFLNNYFHFYRHSSRVTVLKGKWFQRVPLLKEPYIRWGRAADQSLSKTMYLTDINILPQFSHDEFEKKMERNEIHLFSWKFYVYKTCMNSVCAAFWMNCIYAYSTLDFLLGREEESFHSQRAVVVVHRSPRTKGAKMR